MLDDPGIGASMLLFSFKMSLWLALSGKFGG
jgi:hypothetical protein